MNSQHQIQPAQNCSFPQRKGNTVKPLIGGSEFYADLYDSIHNAKKCVYVMISFGAWSFQFPNGKLWWQEFNELWEVMQKPLFIFYFILFFCDFAKCYMSFVPFVKRDIILKMKSIIIIFVNKNRKEFKYACYFGEIQAFVGVKII